MDFEIEVLKIIVEYEVVIVSRDDVVIVNFMVFLFEVIVDGFKKYYYEN